MLQMKDFRRIISEAFLIGFFLLLLFCASNESELSKRIAVFSVNGSKPILATIILLVAFSFICIQHMKIKTDNVMNLLIVRFILYLIPCFLVQESTEFQIGLVAGVACSFMAYSLGKESTCTDKFIAIVMSTAAIVIAFQVLMTAQIRGLNINSSDLKWWMVIPIGQTNAIGTYFIPMVIVLDGFKNTKRGIYKSVLITIEWGLIASILFMGSRSTFILMGIYMIIRYLVPRTTISKKMMSRMLFAILIAVVGVIVVLLNNKNVMIQFAGKFNFNSLTYTRFKVYQETLAVFGQHFLLGRGAYAYKVYDAVMAHNFVLESLVESGILGSIPFFIALIICLRRMNQLKRMRSTYLYAVVFMLIKAMIEPTFYLVSIEIFFWLFVGFGVRQEMESEV